MSLATSRQAVADALNTIISPAGSALKVGVRTPLAPQAGDGWVTVGKITPNHFTDSRITFTAVIALGSDENRAEDWMEALGVAVIDAVTRNLLVADVSAEPIQILVGTNSAPTYALSVTMTMEV